MTITVSTIANTQTFGAWLATTNRLANLMSQNTVTADSSNGGSITTGNSFVNGYFGSEFLYVANTLIGGNVSSNGLLRIQTDVAFVNSTANVIVAVANGNIGIGNSTPNTRLFVTGNVNVIGTMFGNNLTTSNIVSTNSATFSNNVFVVANGNLGVGTSTPASAITVSVGANSDAVIRVNQNQSRNVSTTRAALFLDKAGVNQFALNIDGSVGANGVTYYEARTATGSHVFFTDNTEKLRIAANGNLGVGTSTPNTRLSVVGGANITTTLSVGANVNLSTTALTVGNTTVNAVISAGSLTINGVNVNTAITGNASTAYTNAITVAANATNLTNGTVPSDRLSGTYGISISGTANNSTNLNGQPASFYTNIPARLGYTPVNRAGDTMTGTLIAPYFRVTAQGGTEGGELQLARPISGTSLSGDVSIDIESNFFRVFENGGAFRGFVVDITQCASQSVLLHSNNFNTYITKFLPYVHIQHEASGATTVFPTTNAWTAVPLNTVKTTANTIPGSTFTAPTLSLPPGTYRFRARQVFGFTGGRPQLRLRNVSNNITLGVSGSIDINGDRGQNNLTLEGTFNLTGPTNVQLQYYTQGGNIGQGTTATGEDFAHGSLFVEQIA